MPRLERFGPSVLVEAGSERFLVDCGRGAAQRLFQLGRALTDVSAVFLTHLHSDHVVGIPDLWLTGWFQGRKIPLRAWGPPGTREMTSHLEMAYQFDIRIRSQFEDLPVQAAALVATDIAEGIAYERDGLKITAFSVDHGHVKPTFGYRIDYQRRSVVVSGDTRYSENLIRFARGTDVLIHPVVVVEPVLRASDRANRILELFSTPDHVGEVFRQVNPKLAVYTHYNTTKDLIGLTRKTYSGALEVGEDLMTIEVGEQVRVRRFGE